MTSTVLTRPPGRLALTLAALGVVYGDIGTSPIYTIALLFGSEGEFLPVEEDVLGFLSLIVWALAVVVTAKYVFTILRIDNRGEGGILAVLALALRGRPAGPARRALMTAGLVGVAMFFADSLVTPAISVVSAVEGLEVAAPGLDDVVVPLSIVILTALFAVQARGTARLGRAFGPIILVWFAALALMGARQIAIEPGVLAAFDPRHGVDFLLRHDMAGFLALSIVFLAVTGAEALYADLGHFGRGAIRLGWLGVALPALIVNYLGQGALILHDPGAARHPFFLLAPSWALYPLIVLTTLATIIASQAVISGAFSDARQAVQLGMLPRMGVQHTSEAMIGQIYVPRINAVMFVGVLILVIWFGSSAAIASAYGVAVAATMVCTVVLAASVYLDRRLLPAPLVWLLFGSFMVVDLAFLAASSTKLASGAFLPLGLGLLLFAAMSTWLRGRDLLEQARRDGALTLELFLDRVTGDHPERVAGTAVFLTEDVTLTPRTLLHNLKHNRILHERIVMVEVRVTDDASVETANRIVVTALGKRFYSCVIRFGFFEIPDVPAALALAAGQGLEIDPADTSYFLGRRKLLPSPRTRLSRWRQRLFLALARNAQGAGDYFCLPPNRVVELGSVIEV